MSRLTPIRSGKARKIALFCACIAVAALAMAGNPVQETPTLTLAVVVHKSSQFDSLTSSLLRKVLSGELSEWPDSSKVVLAQQSPESPVFLETLKQVLHTDAKTYKRRLLQVEFAGRDLPLIKSLVSDEMVVKFVGNVPGAIGVVDGTAVAGAASRIKVLRIDGKLPGDQGYTLR